MKITFLGTNGWYDTETGNTICTLIETRKEYIILDAGNGLYKIGKYIKTKKPIYIFLSHFHLDHIIGLHILSKFHFKQKLYIYGQKGTKRILNQIINAPFTASFRQLPFRATVHDFSEGVHHIPFYVKCKFLVHFSRCLGYRFKLEDKIIAYCTDTAFCENAVDLAKSADLLIAECSYAPGQHDKKWPHLNPENAAQIAKQAKVKKMALTHFDASIYQTFKERKLAEKQAKKIFSNTFGAIDNMEVGV